MFLCSSRCLKMGQNNQDTNRSVNRRTFALAVFATMSALALSSMVAGPACARDAATETLLMKTCGGLGDTAAAAADARDKGVPESPCDGRIYRTTEDKSASIRKLMLTVVHSAYQNPSVTGPELRDITMTMCVGEMGKSLP
jgi:hypothetical protein